LALVDGRSTFALLGSHAANEMQQAGVRFGTEKLTWPDGVPGCRDGERSENQERKEASHGGQYPRGMPAEYAGQLGNSK
jgi:hypothetical protein